MDFVHLTHLVHIPVLKTFKLSIIDLKKRFASPLYYSRVIQKYATNYIS